MSELLWIIVAFLLAFKSLIMFIKLVKYEEAFDKIKRELSDSKDKLKYVLQINETYLVIIQFQDDPLYIRILEYEYFLRELLLREFKKKFDWIQVWKYDKKINELELFSEYDPKNPHCEYCGIILSNDEAKLQEDPYDRDINEDHTPHLICVRCYDERCEDI
jgi:hypothetical protein